MKKILIIISLFLIASLGFSFLVTNSIHISSGDNIVIDDPGEDDPEEDDPKEDDPGNNDYVSKTVTISNVEELDNFVLGYGYYFNAVIENETISCTSENQYLFSIKNQLEEFFDLDTEISFTFDHIPANVIKFSIYITSEAQSFTYFATTGMTWSDWVSSDYNKNYYLTTYSGSIGNITLTYLKWTISDNSIRLSLNGGGSFVEIDDIVLTDVISQGMIYVAYQNMDMGN